MDIGMGIGGVGLLYTVIAAPVLFRLEIAALTCGILGLAGKFVGRRLAVKAQKHDEVRILAESKLNTIADHVSTSLLDGKISDNEFRLITDELAKISQIKLKIRAEAQKMHANVAAPVLDEETKSPHSERERRSASQLHKKACHFRVSFALRLLMEAEAYTCAWVFVHERGSGRVSTLPDCETPREQQQGLGKRRWKLGGTCCAQRLSCIGVPARTPVTTAGGRWFSCMDTSPLVRNP